MASKFEALRGMEDILPGEIEKWQWIEEKTRIFFESQGFKEIRTPILEYTDLFTRSVGESSDIVHKEMFSFEDRGGRNVTMRPEMTASVARSVIEKGLLSQAKSLRFYYIGPMFRAERPQAGRKRQFHQIGIEMINEAGLEADFTAIKTLYDFLKFTGVSQPHIRVNDLGESSERTKVLDGLRLYFSNQKAKLCSDCEWRLEKNVLRIFDCKVPSCQPVIDDAPWEKISPVSEHFQKLTDELESHKIPFEVKRRLVRGLDYYTGVVFEVSASTLGAQDALAGGGRYDRLYSDLGGKTTPCTGYSIGFERLLTVLDKEEQPLSKKLAEATVFFIPLVNASDGEAQDISEKVNEAVSDLRRLGIRAVRNYNLTSNLGDHLKAANKIGAKYVVILGQSEFQSGTWQVKNMQLKEQVGVPFYDSDKRTGGLFLYFQQKEGLKLI